MDSQTRSSTINRRTLRATASAVLAETPLGRLPCLGEAAQRDPQRQGVLNFGTRTDAAGLDSHRHNQLHTSTPAAAMYTGLVDYEQQGNMIPGIAACTN